MFGNQYQQAVTDETALRRQQANTGGMTGWGAITNAMSGIGSEIGYQSGQMFGGQTPAQVQQEKYQGVISSMPDFDPSDPTQMKEMSSKLWTGGFYDEGMAMLKESYEMQKVDALMQYYKDQGAAALYKAAVPPKRTPDTAPTTAEYDSIMGMINQAFDTSYFDFIDPDIPLDKSKEWLVGFIHDYARVTDLTQGQVIDGILDASIDISKAIPGASLPSTSDSAVSSTIGDPSVTLAQR
jgi:hypothetical protein